MSTESEKIQQIIDKLPAELQTYGSHYAALLLTFQTDEISAMLDELIGGDVSLAYRVLVSKMTDTQLLSELDTINAALMEQNSQSEAEGEYLKGFLKVAIAIGLAAL